MKEAGRSEQKNYNATQTGFIFIKTWLALKRAVGLCIVLFSFCIHTCPYMSYTIDSISSFEHQKFFQCVVGRPYLQSATPNSPSAVCSLHHLPFDFSVHHHPSFRLCFQAFASHSSLHFGRSPFSEWQVSAEPVTVLVAFPGFVWQKYCLLSAF